MTTVPDRTEPLAFARDLSFRYGGDSGKVGSRLPPFELVVPSLSIVPGDSTVIFGPSGSGKSTLLKLLGGILRPTSGSLDVCGTSLHRSSDRERRRFRLDTVGFVFQDYPLVESLNAIENVLLPFRLGASERVSGETRARALGLLDQLNLANRAVARPRELSQGERQRVAIARALVTRPKLILADEPTTGLDPIRTSEAIDLLMEVQDSTDATVVAVSHDPTLQQRFDRALDTQQLIRQPDRPS